MTSRVTESELPEIPQHIISCISNAVDQYQTTSSLWDIYTDRRGAQQSIRFLSIQKHEDILSALTPLYGTLIQELLKRERVEVG